MRLYIGKRSGTKTLTSGYELGTMKKYWDENKGFPCDILVEAFCQDGFEKITGIKLAPGEIRKVKSIKIELEE